MKVKTFSGPTLQDVMENVREMLGPDAIILETRALKGKPVTVRAAVEAMPTPQAKREEAGAAIALEADLERRLREDLLGVIRTETLKTRSARINAEEPPAHTPAKKDAPDSDTTDIGVETVEPDETGWRRTGTMGIVSRKIKKPGRIDPEDPNTAQRATKGQDALPQSEVEKIAEVLTFHGVPRLLRDDLIRTARIFDVEDALSALAGAIDARFTMQPVAALPARPIMLVGAPGVGKTVTAAKLAARAVLLGRGVDIISTDTLRAGAREQMESFTNILKEKLICAASPDELVAHLERRQSEPNKRPCFIDTPGTNPFSKDEVADLRKFVKALDVEPVLVTTAGIDPAELMDLSQVFATMGVQRMITTRIDAARRLGGIFATADQTKLHLAQFSMTPYVARGLATMNPMSIAKLLLEGFSAHQNSASTPLNPTASDLRKPNAQVS